MFSRREKVIYQLFPRPRSLNFDSSLLRRSSCIWRRGRYPSGTRDDRRTVPCRTVSDRNSIASHVFKRGDYLGRWDVHGPLDVPLQDSKAAAARSKHIFAPGLVQSELLFKQASKQCTVRILKRSSTRPLTVV